MQDCMYYTTGGKKGRFYIQIYHLVRKTLNSLKQMPNMYEEKKKGPVLQLGSAHLEMLKIVITVTLNYKTRQLPSGFCFRTMFCISTIRTFHAILEKQTAIAMLKMVWMWKDTYPHITAYEHIP